VKYYLILQLNTLLQAFPTPRLLLIQCEKEALFRARCSETEVQSTAKKTRSLKEEQIKTDLGLMVLLQDLTTHVETQNERKIGTSLAGKIVDFYANTNSLL